MPPTPRNPNLFSGVQDRNLQTPALTPRPFNPNLSSSQFGQSLRPKLGAALDQAMLSRSYSHKGGLGLAARHILTGKYGLPPRVQSVLTGQKLEGEGGGMYGGVGEVD